MQKLYRNIDGRLHYHEAWVNDGVLFEHWGVVGDQGETSEMQLRDGADPDDAISNALRPAMESGYCSVEPEDHATLLIEYPVAGMGSKGDLDKRHALEERMNETLGWTGLGFCDGGSIGSGTMEVCCYVVDFDTAVQVITSDLKDTEFADYSRIFNEDA